MRPPEHSSLTSSLVLDLTLQVLVLVLVALNSELPGSQLPTDGNTNRQTAIDKSSRHDQREIIEKLAVGVGSPIGSPTGQFVTIAATSPHSRHKEDEGSIFAG